MQNIENVTENIADVKEVINIENEEKDAGQDLSEVEGEVLESAPHMSIKKILSKDQIAEIIKLYQDGMPPKEIGEKFGIYNNSVTRILKRNNIERNQSSDKISDEQIEYIIDQYVNKKISSEVIAKEIGIHSTTICRIIKRKGYEIRPGTENKRKYKIQEDFFRKIDTAEKAYYLGYMFADGNVSQGKSTIKITLKDIDMYILEKFSKLIYSFTKLTSSNATLSTGEIATYMTLTITSMIMGQDLINLGCVPNKSLILQFPKEGDIPKELMHHFVRGMFDGDGCISIDIQKRAKIDITSSCYFLEGLNKILKEELGINTSIYLHGNGKTTRCMQFSAYDDVIKFRDYIYKDCGEYYLTRKKEKFEQMVKNKDEKIIEIKENNELTKEINAMTPQAPFSGTDLTGKTFNRLTVTSLNLEKYAEGTYAWNCKCSCGNITVVNADKLKSGHTKSCGCWNTEVRIAKAEKMYSVNAKRTPKEASAHKVWKRLAKFESTKDVLFKEFLKVSQEDCVFCQCSAQNSNCYNIAMDDKKSSEFARINGDFHYNGIIKIDGTCKARCKECARIHRKK